MYNGFMKKDIEKLFTQSILALQREKIFPAFDVPEIEISCPKDEKFGDWTTNVAMVLAKITGMRSMEIAEEINRQLITNNLRQFERVEIAPPGYINFYLSKEYLRNIVIEVNEKKEKFGSSNIGRGIKVNNEFISANPTGPLTIGNGRGGFYGDSIGRVLKKSGYDVTNEYYVNNVGEQALKFAHSFHKDDQAIYTGKHIDELRNSRKDLITESVQVSAAPLSEEVMSGYIEPDIEKMQIKFDVFTWEESLYDDGFVDKAIEMLKNKNLIFEQDNALWLKTTEFDDDKDRVLIKSSGEKTYFASDCGYILNKVKRGFKKIVEIWGADHHGYIKRFEAAARALGFKGDLRFIIVQLVKLIKDGKEVRMSKRVGNVVYINELIDMVGHDVARFFFLMYAPDTHMNFDLGLAKERSEKNPVYYVQYAHARISSILRKSEIGERGSTSLDRNDPKRSNLDLLSHKKELSLMRELNKFPELIDEISQSYEVHKLPNYAIKLADKFHAFYEKCRVIDEKNPELTNARLNLVNAVRIVLAEVLRLMGVSAPSRM
jgi:arginyl-tRNA synthetase